MIIELADKFFNIYIAPGIMIALGLCFFFVSIPECRSLDSYKRSRLLMGVAFVVYGLALMVEQIVVREGGEPFGTQARLIVMAISFSQAFLFTSTLVTLLDISYFKPRRIAIEGLLLVLYLVIAFYVSSWSEDMTDVMYYVSVVLYIFLLVRYVLIFRRRFSAYVLCMENYFSDDEEKRLLWVSRLFYYSLGIGILALAYSFVPSALVSFIFLSIAVVYYTCFAIKFINYPFNFSAYKEAIEEVPDVVCCDEAVESEPAKEETMETCGNPEEPSDEDENLMCRIDDLIQKELLYKIPNLTVAMIAVKLSKNHRVVSEVISRCRGKNFKRYINEKRIEEAAALISSGWLQDHTIDALAEECGFGNRVNFYRVFKLIKGVAPTEFSVT
ncbi:MAG: helix-turn-helix domain-containing protein [Muribaculaceae bacterium]